MINIGNVLSSPEFAQSYTVYRETGYWNLGDWISSEHALSMYGPVMPAKPNDIDQVPEGDRVTGVMVFYSTQPIYETHSGNRQTTDGTSDQILWNGYRYRVYSVMPWSDFGYYKALAVRMIST